MDSTPEKALKRSMARLLEKGEHSDMTIVCCDTTYQVHKAIVCPRSEFVEAVFRVNMQESQTCQINLSDYNSRAVKLVIDFFYLLDYTPSHPRSKNASEYGLQLESEAMAIRHAPENMEEHLTPRSKQDKKKNRKSAAGYESPDVDLGNLAQALRTETLLLDHCNVYALADYLQVSELKVLAASKFRTEAAKHWNHPDFYEAIQAIYGTSTGSDRLLRDIVVEILRKNKVLLDRFEYQDLISQLDLSFELLMSVHKNGGWV